MIPTVLVVAGSDSGGGAGIQADIKTVTMLGGHAATAITAVTSQNSREVYEVHPVPPQVVARQMEAVLGDMGAKAVKTGMLVDAATIAAVAEALVRLAPNVPLVVDPVMISKSGAELLRLDAVTALKDLLLPHTAVLTPNIPEAEALLGYAISDVDTQGKAAKALLQLGVQAVLLKGGHLDGEMVTDVLVLKSGETVTLSSLRVAGPPAHGTGCTLASGIAIGLAQNMGLIDAVKRARDYVIRAMETSPNPPIGGGSPMLNHGHTLIPQT